MSRFTGTMYKGANRDAKKDRRAEAEARQSRTPVERTRQYRREQAAR